MNILMFSVVNGLDFLYIYIFLLIFVLILQNLFGLARSVGLYLEIILLSTLVGVRFEVALHKL